MSCSTTLIPIPWAPIGTPSSEPSAVVPSAVVVAHLYGHPVDLRQAQALADAAGSILIEDAAQGVGARYDGRPLGSFGGIRF